MVAKEVGGWEVMGRAAAEPGWVEVGWEVAVAVGMGSPLQPVRRPAVWLPAESTPRVTRPGRGMPAHCKYWLPV